MNKELIQEGIDAYIESEFPLSTFKSWDVVLSFFGSFEDKAHNESLEIYNKLPDEVMVYRGILVMDKLDGRLGVSWTTDLEVAKMFALRFKISGGTPWISKGQISKENIKYFTNARQESEVILNPDDMLWSDYEEIRDAS